MKSARMCRELDAPYFVDGFAGWREAKQVACDLV